MRPGSPLIDGAGDGSRPIATDGGADGCAVAVGDDGGSIEADGGDDGLGALIDVIVARCERS